MNSGHTKQSKQLNTKELKTESLMSSSIFIFFSYPTSSKFVNTLGLTLKKNVESDYKSPLHLFLNCSMISLQISLILFLKP